ncbi:MAG: hypothetical protein M1817_002706 [Caeruleum heppii]|nr:MAG: hypothetical protein M1817_002706 [Caeruleum heppii]
MGIPHLITFLRPYAISFSLCSNDVSSDSGFLRRSHHDVIIDGPALAYHIFHLCVATRPDTLTALDALPPYRELGERTIYFLDQLEGYGCTVRRIFFDGHLPPTKHDIRIARLESYVKQLITYRRIYPNAPFRPNSSAKHRPSLPAPSFLVPAIIEALTRSSRYSPLTSVIPSEADAYCAQYTHDYGGLILTSDSDLLVHDLGSRGGACFFQDLEIDERDHVVKALCYEPCTIAKRLDLKKLMALAFHVKSDPGGSFMQALRRAKQQEQSETRNVNYLNFMDEYKRSSSSPSIVPDTLQLPAKATIILSRLDPRISELVQQYLQSLDASKRIRSPTTYNVYLPFLIDDPSRASAWDTSADIRHLAYSILEDSFYPHSVHRGEGSIMEYNRRGTRIVGSEVPLPNHGETRKQIGSLRSMISNYTPLFAAQPTTSKWRAVATHLLLSQLHKDTAHDTTITSLQSLLPDIFGQDSTKTSPPYPPNKKTSLKTSWQTVHLHANYEGIFYSLRMLRQLVDVTLAFHGTNIGECQPTGLLPHELQEIQCLLEDLPCLAEFFDDTNQDEAVEQNKVLQAVLDKVRGDQSNGEEENGRVESSEGERQMGSDPRSPIETNNPEKVKKKKKKGKKRRKKTTNSDDTLIKNSSLDPTRTTAGSKNEANMYDVLR